MRQGFFGLILAIVCTGAWAVNEVVPKYQTVDEVSIKIDGNMDESAWDRATIITDLVQVFPDDSGSRPTLDTVIKILYTEKGLYVGFWGETPEDKQLGRLSFRDSGNVERDWFRVSIDPDGQGVNGYYMELALGGSLRDGTIVNERNRRSEWDGPWQGDTRSDENGWSGEMYLPWSMFAIPDSQKDELAMGVHFERWVSHLSERWSWEPLSDRDPRFLSGFSRMRVRNVTKPSSLTIYPYASGSQDQLNDTGQGNTGLDVFWNPTPGLQIAATALPDFGQVESDRLVINLGAIEVFFPEKRPFFLENRDIFNTKKYNLVHTRRIGARPDIPDAPEGFSADGVVGASEILNATKVTGQKGAFRYGTMVAIEDDADYNLINDQTGEVQSVKAEGRRFYSGRVMREHHTSSGGYYSIGYLGTMTDRNAIDRNANVNSIDARYRSGEGKWNVAWQALHSRIDDGSEAESGFGSWIDATYRPNKRWRHWAEYVYFDDKININDQGFLWRNDQRWFGHNSRRVEYDLPNLRRREMYLRTWRAENSNHERINTGAEIGAVWELNSRQTFRAEVEYQPDRWNDRISRDNGSVRFRSDWSTRVTYDSDSRNRMGMFAVFAMRREQFGSKPTMIYEAYTRYTVNDHFELRLNTTYRDRHGWLLWREDKTFGVYDGQQLIPSLRTNVLVSPRQDARLVVQWVAIRAEATELRELGENGNLLPSLLDPETESFAVGSLAIQFRYRYEIAPLSDLFFVYSRGGSFDTDGSNVAQAGFGDIWSDGFSNKTADQFLAKVRYRFN